MIDPRIEMVDIEPDGFGLVNQLASLRPARAELHVLHRRGLVVRAVHTRAGVVHTLKGRTIQPTEDGADALRAETDVARAILVDAERLAELALPLSQAFDAPTQDEMMIRSRRVFAERGAMIAVPPQSYDEWDAWSAHLRNLGEDYVAFVAGYDGEACAFTLVGRVRDGLLSRVTSLPPGERPPLTSAASLVDAAGAAGPVRIAVVADVEVFAAALSSRSIRPLVEGAAVCFGLPGMTP